MILRKWQEGDREIGCMECVKFAVARMKISLKKGLQIYLCQSCTENLEEKLGKTLWTSTGCRKDDDGTGAP